ncbi:MAG TPA: SCO family protein, partial [Acidimicrobiales bacterium]|nr:SCO family protein [Acidimicrobiales bacterium]
AFHLVDQNGQPVGLASLRGKAVALTFLDPVCTSDCPLIAQEFKAADAMLGTSARRVEMIAVDANPIDTDPAFLRAFDAQEHLSSVPNWRYLTGPLSALRSVWNAYGVQVQAEDAGAMVAHTEIAYVIDRSGHTRYVLDADPGPGSWATQSSFSATLVGAIDTALRQS